MRRVEGLKALVGEFDALICDVWGVLHNGVRAFPAAVDAIRRFRREGPVVLVTNAPRPTPSVRPQLRALGVSDDSYDAIVTSGDVTRGLIAARPGVKIFHIGSPRQLPFYEGLDVAFVAEAEAELVSCTGLVDDETETPEDYRELLQRFVARRLPMVCANPDIVVEHGNKLIFCAGALARLYEDLGGEAILAGKPHAPIYDAARAQIAGRGGTRPLAVGDGLGTDIRGAVDNGLPALFVTGGIHAADFGAVDEPDGALVAKRLATEGLHAVAYIPMLCWDAEARG
jgi:HAD superfamily hydrolase (TIGR01459 family)